MAARLIEWNVFAHRHFLNNLVSVRDLLNVNLIQKKISVIDWIFEEYYFIYANRMCSLKKTVLSGVLQTSMELVFQFYVAEDIGHFFYFATAMTQGCNSRCTQQKWTKRSAVDKSPFWQKYNIVEPVLLQMFDDKLNKAGKN